MSQTVPMPSWAKQFKIDDSTWADLCQQAQKNQVTELDIALEMGLLNENKLLEWDRNLSGMASLQAIFFNGEPPTNLWKDQDYKKCRANACLPVGQWDGKIYWAKISSAQTEIEKENSSHGIWVLGPWSGIKKWFALWQDHKEGPAIPDSPVGLTIKLEEQNSEAEPVVENRPVGLGQDTKELDIDFSNISLQTDDHAGDHADDHAGDQIDNHSEIPTIVKPTAKIAEKPEGKVVPDLPLNAGANARPTLSSFELDVVMDDKPEEEPTVLPPIPAKPPTPIVPVATRATPTPVGPPLATIPKASTKENTLGSKVDTQTAVKMAMPPIPTMETVLPPPAQEKPAPMPPPSSTAPPVIASISPIPEVEEYTPPPQTQGSGDIATIPLDQLEPRLKHTTNQESLTQAFMGVWQNYFDKIMILLLQNESLLMWWHNNRWQNTIEKGEKVPLDTPSIFKIVVDSGHPYHGRVVPSEVNDLFFQKTNGGEYPEHVTLVPVLAQDRAVALLMGTCSQDTGSHLVLSRLENDAQTFATALMRVKSIAKKAG